MALLGSGSSPPRDARPTPLSATAQPTCRRAQPPRFLSFNFFILTLLERYFPEFWEQNPGFPFSHLAATLLKPFSVNTFGKKEKGEVEERKGERGKGETGARVQGKKGKGNRAKRGKGFGERENGEGFRGKGDRLKGGRRLRETEREG